MAFKHLSSGLVSPRYRDGRFGDLFVESVSLAHEFVQFVRDVPSSPHSRGPFADRFAVLLSLVIGVQGCL
jgi:hypothetical protein